MQKILLLAAAMALGGCAAMSEAECRTGDWYGIGERDGRAGHQSRLGDYAEACQKAGVLPDTAEYANGRERGLRAYCTAENGYREGDSGRSYQNVCAPELQAGFLREYERGRVRYELRQEMQRVSNDIERWERDIAKLNEQISKAASDEEKRKLRQEREKLERERRNARQQQLLLQSRWTLLPD